MNDVRREERIRELYLTQKQENLDASLTQTSNGGIHLPLGGGTIPRNSPSKARSPVTNHHHKQRSWDPLESGVDDLKGNFPLFLPIRSHLPFIGMEWGRIGLIQSKSGN